MTKTIKLLAFALMVLSFGSTIALAQKKAPDYKISNIKIMPFSENIGEFGEEIKKDSDISFFNRLDVNLLVTVEISGKTDSFETGRKVEVTVMEGKKIKVKKLEQVGYIGDNGKFFFPVWLSSAMCSEVTITARLVGQKTVSKMTRKVPFMCGE